MADFGSRVLGSEQLERLSKGITKSFGIVTGGTVTLDAADATNPRLDIVYIDTSGAVGKVTGTPAATPAPPEIGDTRLAFAEVIVVANDTVIASGDIVDKRQIIKPDYIWVQPHAVSASGATLASIADTPYAAALLGTASADGAAHFTVPIPVNFQGLRRAFINGLPNGTGNMHYEVTTNFAAHGEAKGTHTDSISTTLVAVTDNQMINIDISAAFTGISAGDFVGVLFNRDGDNAADSVTDFMCHGLMLEYF